MTHSWDSSIKTWAATWQGNAWAIVMLLCKSDGLPSSTYKRQRGLCTPQSALDVFDNQSYKNMDQEHLLQMEASYSKQNSAVSSRSSCLKKLREAIALIASNMREAMPLEDTAEFHGVPCIVQGCASMCQNCIRCLHPKVHRTSLSESFLGSLDARQWSSMRSRFELGSRGTPVCELYWIDSTGDPASHSIPYKA